MSEFKERAQAVADEIVEMLDGKNSDYGQNNITEFGMHGILVRANDKMARLKNLRYLTVNEKPKINETLNDTWADLAGYAIIALMLRKGTFTDGNN